MPLVLQGISQLQIMDWAGGKNGKINKLHLQLWDWTHQGLKGTCQCYYSQSRHRTSRLTKKHQLQRQRGIREPVSGLIMSLLTQKQLISCLWIEIHWRTVPEFLYAPTSSASYPFLSHCQTAESWCTSSIPEVCLGSLLFSVTFYEATPWPEMFTTKMCGLPYIN